MRRFERYTYRPDRLSEGRLSYRHLFCKKAFEARKSLDFNGVSEWVVQKHGGLLAHLPFEPDIGLDDKFCCGVSEALRERFPLHHVQDDAKMWNWNSVVIHLVMMNAVLRAICHMGYNLMPVEVEIDPFI